MNWTAVVPLKLGPHRKSRLASTLDLATRTALSDHMARHVLTTLAQAPSVGAIWMLAPERPDWAAVEWRRDEGRGLNAELAILADRISGPMLVMHADLPLVRPEDVEALLAAGEGGTAIAPDRHGSGTNALALAMPQGFGFAFGPDSCGKHRAALPVMAVVNHPGLSTDIDTAEDLAAAIAMGFNFPT